MERPEITWIGAHPDNFERGRDGVAFEAIVVHIAEGSLAGIDSWFNDPRARASTHFAVGKGGAIHQYIDLADTAYGHGAIEPGYTARLIDENRRQDGVAISPNRWAVGIEHEGRSGDAMTRPQFDASTRLAAWLFAAVLIPGGATGVAIDRDHVLRHGEISPRSRARCPGYTEEALREYVARVRELVHGAPAAPDPRMAARLRILEDALTVQAAALDDLAARAAIQAANLRRLVQSG
ncbi:MAG: N-acetylmuramoyl-L-alanine amidase [Dehalococcoidia bacterium]